MGTFGDIFTVGRALSQLFGEYWAAAAATAAVAATTVAALRPQPQGRQRRHSHRRECLGQNQTFSVFWMFLGAFERF